MAKMNKHMETYIYNKIKILIREKNKSINEEYNNQVRAARKEIKKIMNETTNSINEIMDKYNLERLDECKIFEYFNVRNYEEEDKLRKKEYELDSKLHLFASKVIASASLEKDLTIEKIDELIDALNLEEE